MSVFRKFVIGASFSVLSAVLSRIILSLGTIAYARILGAAEYGLYVNILAFAGLLNLICLFGFNTAFTAFVPQYKVSAPGKIASLLIAGFLGAILLLVLVGGAIMLRADLLADTLYRNQLSAGSLRLGVLLALGIVLNTLATSALFGFQKFGLYAAVSVGSSVLVLGLSLIGVIWRGIDGLIAGSVAGYLISTLAAIAVVKTRLLPARSPESGGLGIVAREAVRFSFPTFLSGIFVVPAYWLGNLFLVQGGSVSDSGYVGVATSLAQLVLFVPTTLAGPLVPILSEVNTAGDEQRFAELIRKNIKMMWLITLPLVALFCSSAPLLIGLLYGPAFAPALPTFLFLAGANFLNAVEGIVGYVLIAKKKMWDSFVVNGLWFVLFVVSGLQLIGRYGHVGFAMSSFFAYALFGVIVLVALRRHVEFPLRGRHSLAAGGTTAVVFFLAWEIAHLAAPVAATISLVACLFALLCVLEWRFFMTDQERGMLLNTARSFTGRSS